MADIRELFTVYKTTCLVNGKIYIGVHKTRDPNDAYLGSGLMFKAAIKKYGRASFTKEVLFVFATPEEMIAKEKELVDTDFCAREDTYNLHTGGSFTPHQGFSEDALQRIREASAKRVGWNHAEATKLRLRASKTGTKASAETVERLRAYPRTEEHRKKLSDAGKGRPVSAESRKKLSIASSGRKHSEEAKLKMKEAWGRRREKGETKSEAP